MKKPRLVLITTSYKGVFVGSTSEDLTGKDPIKLKDCVMVIYWGTKNGLFELAKTGPTGTSKLSDKVPEIELRSITAVIEVTDEASKAWEATI